MCVCFKHLCFVVLCVLLASKSSKKKICLIEIKRIEQTCCDNLLLGHISTDLVLGLSHDLVFGPT
jgi:hypothetical protein